MPQKNAISAAAHTATAVPVGVTTLTILGIPLNEWAYIAAIVSALFAVVSYSVKMWRDWQIGKAAKNRRVILSDDE